MARVPRELLRHMHLGTQFVIILVLFVLGGSWLDERLHTGGFLVLAAVLLGAGIGFYLIYRETQEK